MNFAEVERVVAKLRQDLAAGRLTEEQFKARLRELMVQDQEGNWWMVGYETGGWYRHDGTDWVRADPPSRAAPRAAPQPMVQPLAPAKPRPRPSWGIVVLVFGLVITLFLCSVLSSTLVEEAVQSRGAGLDIVVLPLALVGGLILTGAVTYMVWRPKPGWAWGIVVLVLGLLLTLAAMFFVGALLGQLNGDEVGGLVAGIIGLGGLILTIAATVKAWRGKWFTLPQVTNLRED